MSNEHGESLTLEAHPLAANFYPRCLETDGTALELFLNDQHAGLVAASRTVEQGLRGFGVDQVVLRDVARGSMSK